MSIDGGARLPRPLTHPARLRVAITVPPEVPLPILRGALRSFILVALLLAPLAPARAAVEPDSAYAPGEVLIKFKSGVPAGKRQSLLSEMNAIEPRTIGGTSIQLVRLRGIDVEQAIARFRGRPEVEYVEPNYVLHALATPDDSLFSRQWGLRNLGQSGGVAGADVRATSAWDVTTGSDEVLIGVIDTGIDYRHPDLAANTVPGWDFVNGDSDPMDDNGHGTHVAGIIGARGDNRIGIAGVCWHVRLLPLKFLDQAGGGYDSEAIQAIDYAARRGARVINASWGGPYYSQALRDAIAGAGVLFVAAAGNSA